MGTSLIIPGAEPDHRRTVLYGSDGRILRIGEITRPTHVRVTRLDADGNPTGPSSAVPIDRIALTRTPPTELHCPPVDFDATTVHHVTLTFAGLPPAAASFYAG